MNVSCLSFSSRTFTYFFASLLILIIFFQKCAVGTVSSFAFPICKFFFHFCWSLLFFDHSSFLPSCLVLLSAYFRDPSSPLSNVLILWRRLLPPYHTGPSSSFHLPSIFLFYTPLCFCSIVYLPHLFSAFVFLLLLFILLLVSLRHLFPSINTSHQFLLPKFNSLLFV